MSLRRIALVPLVLGCSSLLGACWFPGGGAPTAVLEFDAATYDAELNGLGTGYQVDLVITNESDVNDTEIPSFAFSGADLANPLVNSVVIGAAPTFNSCLLPLFAHNTCSIRVFFDVEATLDTATVTISVEGGPGTEGDTAEMTVSPIN